MEDLLEKIARDTEVPHEWKGVFLEAYYAPDNKVQQSVYVSTDCIDLLLDLGYIDKDGDDYYIAGAHVGDEEIMKMWKGVYTDYPGRKRGVNVELKLLKSKYNRGKWRQIIQEMFDGMNRQISEREEYEKAMAVQVAQGNRYHNMFLPGWKNMQTYIRQQAWTEEYLVPEKFKVVDQQRPVHAAGTAYDRYVLWATDIAKSHALDAVVHQYILSEQEFLAVLNEHHEKFRDYRYYITEDMMKKVIVEAQGEYFRLNQLRLLFPKFIDYLYTQYQKHKHQ